MILDFKKIGLNKICAAHLKRNPASGKVMQNIGMEQEGVFKEHVKKWGGNMKTWFIMECCEIERSFYEFSPSVVSRRILPQALNHN